MLALRKILKTHSNKLYITIPNEMKNRELEVIIMPVTDKESNQFEFWTDEELNKLSHVQLGTTIPDNEDFSKW